MRFVSLLGVTFFEALAARRRSGPTRPSWNLQFEWIVRFLRRDFLEAAGWPYPELRKELDSRPGPKTAQRRVAIRDDRVGGVPVVWFTPPELRSDAVLVFFHGGSYIIGSARTTHADQRAAGVGSGHAAMCGSGGRRVAGRSGLHWSACGVRGCGSAHRAGAGG